jgi:hypothetical protein
MVAPFLRWRGAPLLSLLKEMGEPLMRRIRFFAHAGAIIG